jgi:hypothetical protein
MADMSQSLLSKVMQFGEAEFWGQWFHEYARNADALDSKTANIVGVKGVRTEEIEFKDFNTKFPPGIMVYSAKEAEYKELVLRRDLMQLYPQLQQTLDPDGMRNFNKFVFFPKFLQDPSLVDIIFPKTIQEMKAEGENEQLAKDKMPDVLPTDDHETHIYIHNMVEPKTWATWVHITWHEKLLEQQKQQAPQQAPNGQQKVAEAIGFNDLPPAGKVQMAAQAGIQLDPSQVQTPPQGATAPNMQAQNQPPKNSLQTSTQVPKRSPVQAASPLKTAINNKSLVK